jgi:hypothetical protein
MKKFLVIAVVIFMTSCAVFRTSMTPAEVAKALPSLTEARWMSVAQAEQAIETGRARLLARRDYVVPVGLTVQNELKRGARGIDEWVAMDGGNSYVLVNYKWVRVGDDGATQLHLEFDTLLLE